ncbi:GMC family oxidoreductase [Pseudohoeflea coraliihabitans]|uniref:GMC family oxidoreductase N-terminal domain-containing protein n=1 Tax=Pseudohoeflea coraliihabitans TaxID=2860393 RepID=A0ABS6WPT6_9HYPH|nr:GMC family oxidoreductase N-terminal domain-containing protein [Pseudohoeflea sp. DP4N28-3]MBW3097973.1 GMC family oxidoreductase N-terminal domain-containing protein [Pseudohoeflea sp. DP4N28-3]
MAEGYDYIIVGGGSAGCVLANRLSENDAVRVLLIEAGGRDNHPLIHMPVGFAKLTSGPHTWGFTTTPQKHADNREIPYAQARVIGGGSSINAEVFTRGNPADYDRWAQEEGCEGWSFMEIRNYFLRSEGNSFFAGDWHGTEGELGVSNLAGPQRMTSAFVQACQQRGIPYNPDFNGSVQEGSGVYQTTIRNGRRCSAAVGYLRPAMKRRNLTVKTGCMVQRIVIEKGRAIGVDYIDKAGRQSARADAEVLVTSGAIGTPKLMMLSGLGPAAHLGEHGIAVVQDMPGVGANLNDHFGIDIVAELKRHDSLDKYNRLHWMVWAGAQYYLFGTGPVTSNVVEGGAFWYADNSQPVPDLQFHFLAGAGAEAGVPSVPAGSSGITLNSYTLRPKARGTVRLRSARPDDLPLVDPNFLGHPDDLKTSVEGLKISREIFEQPALKKYIRKIRFPDEDVKSQSDYEAYARRYGRTSYHPTCTCKMGADSDPMAVVDPQLRVRGVDGLRICDSSAMPSLIGSNTNAPTIMIAEKAADLIRGNDTPRH